MQNGHWPHGKWVWNPDIPTQLSLGMGSYKTLCWPTLFCDCKIFAYLRIAFFLSSTKLPDQSACWMSHSSRSGSSWYLWLDLVIKTVNSKDTGLMKESSGMMIVDIRRPSQCDRAPDSWQLTGPRRQHAGCQHNTNQHPAAGTAPEHCPCGHCLRLRHVWRGRLLVIFVMASDEVLILLLTVIHPIQCSVLQFLHCHHFTQYS